MSASRDGQSETCSGEIEKHDLAVEKPFLVLKKLLGVRGVQAVVVADMKMTSRNCLWNWVGDTDPLVSPNLPSEGRGAPVGFV
jgi:hypothetical protein